MGGMLANAGAENCAAAEVCGAAALATGRAACGCCAAAVLGGRVGPRARLYDPVAGGRNGRALCCGRGWPGPRGPEAGAMCVGRDGPVAGGRGRGRGGAGPALRGDAGGVALRAAADGFGEGESGGAM